MAQPTMTKTAMPEVQPQPQPRIVPKAANLFTIQAAEEAPAYIKMLVYGASGVGKTHLSATSHDCPLLRDVLYLDVEAGAATLISAGYTNVDVVPIKNWSQLVRVYEFLHAFCVLRDQGAPEEKMRQLFARVGLGDRQILPNYRTVIIDTLDEVQEYCMKNVQGQDPQNMSLSAQYMKPGWPEYGEVLERMKTVTRNFRNLPMHVVASCHQEVKQDEAQRMMIVPSLVGKFEIVAQAYFDFVAYYAAKTVASEGGTTIKRRLYIAPGQNFNAKNRCNAVEGWIDNPTMEKVLNLLKSSNLSNK